MTHEFALTNDDRRYLGLPPVEENWEELVLGGTVLLLDGNRVRRRIRRGEHLGYGEYVEEKIDRELSEDRTLILPATGRGKPAKLTEATAGSRLGPSGMAVTLGGGVASIVSFRSQHWYPEEDPDVPDPSEVSAAEWLAAWKETSTPADLDDIAAFAALERENVKYKEGDVFAFRHTRREWGFGRILMDRAARVKAGDIPKGQEYGYMSYMGRVVLVEVFRVLSPTPEVDVEELVRLPRLPSHMVMDDALFYGQWPIIGHVPVEEIDHLLMVGASLAFDDDLYFIQDGFRYETMPGADLLGQLPEEVIETMEIMSFAAAPSGRSLSVRTLRACIEADSNDPYWDSDPRDLRSPANTEIRAHLVGAFAERS